jgi:hypothetical protein
LPPKKSNKFILFIKKLLKKIFTKKLLYSSIIIFITGFISRYFIQEFLNVDVFKDYLNIISITYYSFMSIYITGIREIIDQLEINNFMMANPGAGGNPPGGNPPGGNPGQPGIRAGRVNGPIQVNNPLNQQYIYIPGNSHQPLMGNIAISLQHQANIGLTSLSRYTFTPEQEQFILAYLLHDHPDVYHIIMDRELSNANPNTDQPQ